MPLRLSERTRSSRAASTISRFVLRRVSLRALRTKLSSITMFVLPINTVYTKCPECGVWGGKGERGRQEFRTLRPAKPSGTHKPCCAKNGAPGVKEIEEESPPSKNEDGAPKFFLRLTSGPPVLTLRKTRDRFGEDWPILKQFVCEGWAVEVIEPIAP